MGNDKNTVNPYYYKLSMILGSAALIIDSLVMMWTGIFDDWIFIGLMLGLLCITLSFWQYIGAQGETKDERMLRISTYAITLSWFTSLMIVGYTALIVFYKNMNFNAVQAVGYMIFIMLVTMLTWLAYYSNKGDVELPE